MQVDELKSAPNDERDGGLSAPELAQRALYRELNGEPAPCQDLPVNVLTSMVVKKTKKAPAPAPKLSGAAEAQSGGRGGGDSTGQDARLGECCAMTHESRAAISAVFCISTTSYIDIHATTCVLPFFSERQFGCVDG